MGYIERIIGILEQQVETMRVIVYDVQKLKVQNKVLAQAILEQQKHSQLSPQTIKSLEKIGGK